MTHQTEDGHLRLANTLVDALIESHLSKREWQVVMFLLRRSYGFSQKHCRATSTFIAQGTGLDASHVRAVLRDLEAAGCIEREGQMVIIRKQGFPIDRGSERSKRAETARAKTARAKTARQAGQNSPANGPKRPTSTNTSTDTFTNKGIPPTPQRVTDATWADYVKHRKQKRSSLTDIAYKRLCRKLDGMTDPEGALVHSMEQGWTGVFEPKQQRVDGSPGRGDGPRTEDGQFDWETYLQRFEPKGDDNGRH